MLLKTDKFSCSSRHQSDTFFGENWVYVFETPLVIAGTLLAVGGFLVVLREALTIYSRRTETRKIGFEEIR